MTRRPYQRPVGPTIRRTRETRRLYRLEDKARRAIEKVAHETAYVLRCDETRALPEALYAMLDRWTHTEAAFEAAVAWLEDHGYEVTRADHDDAPWEDWPDVL